MTTTKRVQGHVLALILLICCFAGYATGGAAASGHQAVVNQPPAQVSPTTTASSPALGAPVRGGNDGHANHGKKQGKEKHTGGKGKHRDN